MLKSSSLVLAVGSEITLVSKADNTMLASGLFATPISKPRGSDDHSGITHPATSTHMHLVFKDAKTGKMVTGHVEQIGLLEGAVLRLPKLK